MISSPPPDGRDSIGAMTLLALVLATALAAEAPAPVAPARDIHSHGNPALVRPSHVGLDLTVDFGKKQIRGIADLQLAYGKEKATELVLDARDLTIASVVETATGKPLAFRLGAADAHLGQPLVVTLPAPVKAVRITYSTSPGAAALQWLEPRQTSSGKLPFLFTQGQAILTRTWIPLIDSPGVRVTYDATVHVPPTVTAVMAAEHGKHEPEKGIYRFKMDKPIPPYLIALAAGELAFKALSERTGVWAEPAVLDRAAYEFADAEKMVQVTERLYGPYAWGRYDVLVLPPSFPFGGMENPRLTFATPTVLAGDRSLVGLLAHELAHSWSGNLVTNATWADFWLNEGFTRYIESRIVEELYGREVADMQNLLGQRELRETVDEMAKSPHPGDSALWVDLTGRDPDEGMNAVPYEKGANLLRLLERHFGREKLDPFLKSWFQGHAFQSTTTTEFVRFLKAELFKGDEKAWADLGVESWIHQPGVPGNLPVPASERFARTKAAAEAFVKTGSLEGVRRDWHTVEWVDFLENLPRTLTAEQMAKLDTELGFSKRGNSEVLFAWLLHVARNAYEPAYPALEDFLTRQGRRKYVKPLFRAMQDNVKTQPLAARIASKAMAGYHPLTAAAVDEILKPKK
jgi:leukotriene-A4 hydrolase